MYDKRIAARFSAYSQKGAGIFLLNIKAAAVDVIFLFMMDLIGLKLISRHNNSLTSCTVGVWTTGWLTFCCLAWMHAQHGRQSSQRTE